MAENLTAVAANIDTNINRVFLSDPLNELFLNPIYFKLALTVLGVFIAGYLTWWMYIKLSNRDILKLKIKHGNFSSFGSAAWYVLEYCVLFPVFSFIWFIAFVACIYFLSTNYPVETIMLIGVVLIGTIRLFAYVNERLAEDFAKLLPLTLLAAILINPSFIKVMGASWQGLLSGLISVAALQYLIFLVILEFILRASYLIILKVRGETIEDEIKARHKKVVADDNNQVANDE